jgi:hypothetical protein
MDITVHGRQQDSLVEALLNFPFHSLVVSTLNQSRFGNELVPSVVYVHGLLLCLLFLAFSEGCCLQGFIHGKEFECEGKALWFCRGYDSHCGIRVELGFNQTWGRAEVFIWVFEVVVPSGF